MDWLILLGLGVILWLWMDTLRAKEIARHAGENLCAQSGEQFLDQTVALRKAWICRQNEGKLKICRVYLFEYYGEGNDRRVGRIVMQGHQIVEAALDAFQAYPPS